MQTQYYLGIDAGGSKTQIVLVDSHGQVVAHSLCPSSNIHSVSQARIISDYKKCLRQLYKSGGLKSSTTLKVVVVGMSGLDSDVDRSVLQAIVKRAFARYLAKNTQVILVNDAIIGFWSGSTNGEGLCVIGGTGSNCYGQTLSGKTAWAGGLGHYLADQGGGYDLGLQALKAAVKSWDGRGSTTILENLILKHLGVKNFRQAVKRLYYQNFSKSDFGQLALLVEKAALLGDKVAIALAKAAALELTLMAQAVARKLNFSSSKAVEIIMIGGVLQHDPVVNKEFKKLMCLKYPHARFITPLKPPIFGAVRLAFKAQRQEWPNQEEFAICQ